MAEEEKNKSENSKKTTESVETEAKVEKKEKEIQKPKTKKPRKKKPSKEVELKEKISELNDKYLRLYSEFDNYRKRTIKEKNDLYKNASADIILSLLPVLDDCKRANKSFEETDDIKAIKDGFEIIFNKFKNILNQKGVKEMKTIGEVFDTEFHEAITKTPGPSKDMKGKIVDEIEKGYFLNDKVLKYAKVVVGE